MQLSNILVIVYSATISQLCIGLKPLKIIGCLLFCTCLHGCIVVLQLGCRLQQLMMWGLMAFSIALASCTANEIVFFWGETMHSCTRIKWLLVPSERIVDSCMLWMAPWRCQPKIANGCRSKQPAAITSKLFAVTYFLIFSATLPPSVILMFLPWYCWSNTKSYSFKSVCANPFSISSTELQSDVNCKNRAEHAWMRSCRLKCS